MKIIVGMLLSCFVKIGEPGPNGSFIKDVPTLVIAIKDNKAFVEYNFSKAPGIDYLDDSKVLSTISINDLISPNYGRCKEIK